MWGGGGAGGSFDGALREAGWEVRLLSHLEVGALRPEDAELVLLCVPDASVAEVAAELSPSSGRVVAHCAGSLGLEVLGEHPRRASVHPLVALPDAVRGARALRGTWFAVAGDPLVAEVVEALGGNQVELDDADRCRYHATAVVASNHLVALMGQVERLADSIGVPLDAYLDLARGALEDVAATGPAKALTGPVARGDWETVRAHLRDLPPAEHDTYLALARSAAQLAGRALPDGLSG